MKLRIRELHEVCMDHPGMWDAFWRVGTRDAAANCIELSREHFDQINAEFLTSKAGTTLHKILAPVVMAADAVLGTKLAECNRCDERELKINAALSK